MTKLENNFIHQSSSTCIWKTYQRLQFIYESICYRGRGRNWDSKYLSIQKTGKSCKRSGSHHNFIFIASIIFRRVKDIDDKIDAGVKCSADVEDDGYISHFIHFRATKFFLLKHNSFSSWDASVHVQSKMKKYGLRSAIFTCINSNRQCIVSKEEVKKHYRAVYNAELGCKPNQV